MRKFMVLPMAGLLVLGAAAPALAGANVSNTSGSMTIAEGGWESYDEATETYTSGYVTVVQDSGNSSTIAEYQQYSERFVQCSGGDTPDDPGDDTYGLVQTFLGGYGDATLSIGKSTASASGSLDMSSGGYDECTGAKSGEAIGTRAFTLNLTATSPTIRESGRGSFHIPGEFNAHSSYKALYRLGEGAVTAGDTTQSVQGQFGKVSWTDHANG